MTWNYRLIKVPLGDEHSHVLAEVYYDATGEIEAWCSASAPEGDTRNEAIRDVLNMARACATSPVIDATTLPGWVDSRQAMARRRPPGTDLHTWVEQTHTLDAQDPAARALEANPGWRLIGVGTGTGGQTTLTYGWPWPTEEGKVDG